MQKLIYAALFTCAASLALAQDQPKLQTSQDYLEELYRGAKAPVGDSKAMLAFVLQGLPERVKVYPTENYYYFGFYSGGVRYAGNIRLDASDRDKGKLHFAYYVDNAEWLDEFPVNYALMGSDEGVTIEKVERFLYRVTAGGKSVLFELNDLSNVRPPEQAIGPDEKFLGPVFDESGIRFFLVYNSKQKLFLFILDDTVPVPDQLTRVKATDRIEIGTRTGFAFYRDQRRERRILIGVYEGNVLANNYFDGPFDQLPDNFLEGDELRQAILDIAPDLKGTLDRFGGSLDGAERFPIAPYALYRRVTDLLPVHACAIGPRGKGERYYRCFDLEDAPANAPDPNQKAQPKGKGAPK
jgi:hypothetical protein